jgi:hypothetical protein
MNNSSIFENNISTPNCAVWLGNTNGQVLVRNISPEQKTLGVDDLTVYTQNTDEVLFEIEDAWKVLCDKDNLQEIYSFEDKDYTEIGLILELDFDKETQEQIEKIFDGRFIDYSGINNYVSPYNKEERDEESLNSLISFMKNRFEGYK